MLSIFFSGCISPVCVLLDLDAADRKQMQQLAAHFLN